MKGNFFEKSPTDIGSTGLSKCQRFGLHDQSKDKPVCSPWDLQPNNITENMVRCLAACPTECEFDKFDVRSTPMAFDEKAVSELLGGNVSDVELEQYMSTHSIVHMSFDHFEYTEIVQYLPMTLGTLMSNVGGLFGLLLGGSVLTLVHTLIFLLQRLLTAVSWRNEIH